jgi:hypothetical protein
MIKDSTGPRPNYFYFLLLGLSFLGVWVVRESVSSGIGLGSDSAVYIAAAKHWLSGHGLSWMSGDQTAQPMTLHAPLYSLILAAFNLFEPDIVEAALWLNLIIFGLNVFLVGLFVRKITHSAEFGLLGAFLFLLTGEMIQIHTWVMSDPLYLTLGLIGIILLTSSAEIPKAPIGGQSIGVLERVPEPARHHRRKNFLIWAAIAVSLAYLDRYIGLSLVIACDVAIFLDSRADLRTRMTNAVLFSLIGILPAGLWQLRNFLLTGSTGGRVFCWNCNDMTAIIKNLTFVTLDWFLPYNLAVGLSARIPVWMPITALIALGAAALLIVRARLTNPNPTPDKETLRASTVLAVLYLVAFLGFVLLTSLLFIPGSDVDHRILAPAYILVLALGLFLTSQAWRRKSRVLRSLILFMIIGLLASKAIPTLRLFRSLQADGQGYSTKSWQNSSTIETLQDLAPAIIYTDDIAAIYLLTGKNAHFVPIQANLVTGEPRPDYQTSLETMRHQLLDDNAVLVIFKEDSWPDELVPLSELRKGLTPIHDSADGTIYAHSP